MIFLLRMYLLSSAYAYRFPCRNDGIPAVSQWGKSCWSQAWLPKPILKFLARNRLYKRPCRLPQSQGIVPSATGTFQSDMRMPAYAYSDKLAPCKTRPTCFCVCGHMQGMSGHVRYVPTLDGRIRTSCSAHGILSRLFCLCFCVCLCVCRHMHIIRHCLLFHTRFPSGLYRTLPCFHQSPDLEDALDREIGGTAPVARDAFHLVSIHSKCNHMFLRMSAYTY